MDSATRVTIISTGCSLRKELESAEFCWWLINIHSEILFLVKLDGRFEFDSKRLSTQNASPLSETSPNKITVLFWSGETF